MNEDLRCEIAVIGAGMAGILTAWRLQAAGHQVVVLEAERIGSGQTRGTTAKITSQHGLKYAELLASLGLERASVYGAANQAAISAYRELVDEKNIDCDFAAADAYIYGDDGELLRREADAAARLGLPADYLARPEAPLPCEAAVRFSGQAQFHPLKFLGALAEDLTVFEHTPVRSVEGSRLQTPGGTVTAERVVFACHYPFPRLPGLYFTRLHQERSYVLALAGARVDGMWIGTGEALLSFRQAGELLLLGGGGHRTGENSAGGQYDFLRKKAKALFPGCREVAHWSAQDCITPDGLSLIGRFSAGHPDWYVATGFQKWGMTASMVAANLLRELMEGRNPPEAAVFSPGRRGAGVLAGLAQEGGHAVKGLTRRLFAVPKSTAEQLAPGHGGVVRLGGKKVGVYRDADGTVYAVDVCCPHLGCQLEWNPEERSWDCPCHGSRFDHQGNLLSGPAQGGVSPAAH